MSSKRSLFTRRISTKLMALNGLIAIVFILIVLVVFMSFHQTQDLIKGIIVDDMNEVTSNILTDRELSSILSDTNFLINTFFEDDKHLQIEGNRILTFALVLVDRNKGGDLETSLQLIAKKIGLILVQCKEVNSSLAQLRLVNKKISVDIARLQETIAVQRINLVLKGSGTGYDATILEQIAALVSGYELSFLEISKLYAESWPDTYYTPLNLDSDPVVTAINSLILRLRTLMASGPEIALMGRNLIDDLLSYRANLLKINDEMVALRIRINELEQAQLQVTDRLERLDRDTVKASKEAEERISQRFRMTEIALLTISISLIITLILLTAYFFRKIIKDPMQNIKEGIEALTGGDLSARIRLDRQDEWHLIETALNTMAKELSSSYAAMQNNHDELENKVMERTAALSEANKQAQLAKRVAEKANRSKSEFLARMSHEIRTPLNAVTGLTGVVLKSDLTTVQRDYLNKVQIASDNLLEVINDILDFSRIEAGRLDLTLAPFNLDLILEQLSDLFSNRIADKDLELIFAVDQDVDRNLTGDAARLTQVLTNLIENAVKFTQTGEIIVQVKLADASETGTDQVTLEFSVNDTGIGIDNVILPTLFEPFTQADSYLTRKHEGSGLGLAICRRLVSLMGGRIWATSNPGAGTTFSFTIIFQQNDEQISPFILRTDLQGMKVLIADDSETARQVLAEQLKSFKFSVLAVDSGEKAIAELVNAGVENPFELLLIDWKMEGLNGLETVKAIRENRNISRSPIIILITAYGLELIHENIDALDIDQVLVKPVKPSQLFDNVVNLLGRRGGPVAQISHQVPDGTKKSQLTGQRALVVEDNELNRTVIVALLEEVGIIVDTAVNGQVAVEKVKDAPTTFYDVILMDIQMPAMDGYKATEHIRKLPQERNSIPIIALTAHAMKGEKEKCLNAGMNDYLAKPIDETELHRVLWSWLNTKQTVPHKNNPAIEEHFKGNQHELDVESALKRFGGRHEIFINSLKIFKSRYNPASQVITDYLAKGDGSTQDLAHSLKSNAAQIGANELCKIAARLEEACRQGTPEEKNMLSILIDELDHTLTIVDNYLNNHPSQ